ncbi:hypothetical protein BX600DRAFT_542201 [Xylariales sp. PMI_506]|nr:hypothetical protein BX600DRAFT_542201 [Xylariales sp. PMI_506]
MARISLILNAGMALLGLTAAQCNKKIIIDTDFWNFDDDPLAIGIANVFQIWNQTEIVAVVSSIFADLTPPAIDAINTYYGHPDIPIGTQKPLTNETQNPEYTEYGDYITGLTYDFPEDLRSGYNTTDPLTIYRKYLSEAEDNSITIVLIGEVDNLYHLLLSPPDEYSTLNGSALISAKVAELAVQAAAYGESYNFYFHNETYAATVVDQWPRDVKLTYIGSNIGGNTFFGARLTTELDLSTQPVAYAFNRSVGYNVTHKTWDATAMYYAIRGIDDVYAYNFTTGHDYADVNATTVWESWGESEENAVIFAENGIGNASFAERLEDILLWQPGQPIPASLAKIAVCAVSNSSTSSTTWANATATSGTLKPSATSTSVLYTAGATKAVLKTSVIGVSLLAAGLLF